MNAAERAAKIVARPMGFLAAIASPFVWLLAKSTAAVTRILGLRESGSKVTEAEIRSIIQEGNRRRGGSGGRTADRRPRLLARRPYRRVDHDPPKRNRMDRPRHDARTDSRNRRTGPTQPIPCRRRKPRQNPRRGPISKTLFLHLTDPDFDIRKLITPGKFFHEEFEVYNALEQLRSEQLGYGIICDEFGVTRGIITLKDIFEALVGELPDPARNPTSCDATTVAHSSTGSALLRLPRRVRRRGRLPPPMPHNTVSGLILDLLGHIPATGEKLEWCGFSFEIVDMDGARIDKILVTHRPQEPEEA